MINRFLLKKSISSLNSNLVNLTWIYHTWIAKQGSVLDLVMELYFSSLFPPYFAKPWLASCNCWRKPEYPLRTITKPHVTGIFLTFPGWNSNTDSGERQLAVSEVPGLVSVEAPNTDITNITWGLVSYGLISGIQFTYLQLGLILMLLVANLANTKWCKKP